MSETIAWIGLGRMGTAMVERLLAAGRDVGVWNRTASKADVLVAAGATRLDAVADAARYDVIVTMVSDDAALRTIHSESGLLNGPVAGRVWIDCSTVSVEAALAAAAAARAAGAAYVSAPVSGNPGVVHTGNAIFAISGDDEAAVDAAERVMSDIGRKVYRVGPGASANVVKLCTNAVLSVIMQSLAEVAVLADGLGVRRAQLMEFINDSAVGSPLTRYKTPNIVELEFPQTFSPFGQRKDIRLALAAASDKEIPMPVLSATEVEYSRLVASGLGEGLDYAALVLQVARDAGMQLRPERAA
ncbi:NAD(P)-dependent oxidoreductase [Microbacterium sp. RD1]|uniref:NAD(P)-dependent oxidoreductase n=1 Tax=Microbacterium sp. RD1 TaxID=3457313 RepID=UPI003FA57951